jgi:hypothetical protein
VDQPRQEIRERAGTRLDHRFTEPVYGSGRRGRIQHGTLDRRQRVYQCGGELKNFVFWKARLVSFDLSVWQVIQDAAEWIEVIDHERNECYRVSIGLARLHGRVYDAGLGPRWGVPLDRFQRLAADGAEIAPSGCRTTEDRS